jgi:uncharacterized protein YcnI
MIRRIHSAALVLGAVTAGILASGGPASAQVEVTPSTAAPGGSAEVTLKLAEERPGAYTTKVELRAPQDTPIAEIYALSVPGWAPLTAMRKLDKPAELIHGTSTTQVVDSLTWKRAPTAGTARKPITLPVAMGPMPQDASQVVFEVIQTYSDGTVVRWADPPKDGAAPGHPAVVIRLTGAPAPAGGHSGHDAPAAPAPQPAAARQEPSEGGSLTAGLLVGAALGAGGGAIAFVLLRRRRGTGPDQESGRAARKKELAKTG